MLKNCLRSFRSRKKKEINRKSEKHKCQAIIPLGLIDRILKFKIVPY